MNPLDVVACGYTLFPCRADKRPRNTGWQNQATNDPKQIARWMSEGVAAFGLPCGMVNGIVVVDLDTCKQTGAPLGECSLRNWPDAEDMLANACVTTPSGGRHLYFADWEGARNTQRALGGGIDTRGAGGFVIVPGSVTARGLYRGHVPPKGSLPPLPPALRAALTPPKRHCSPYAAPSTPPGEVEALLGYIPADCGYGEWLAVLMGLHDRYGGSDAGLVIADRWSAQGEKYRQGEVARKWRSFRAGGGTTWRAVPAIARRYGADLAEISRAFRNGVIPARP